MSGSSRKHIYMNMGLERAVEEAGSLEAAGEMLGVDARRLIDIAGGYANPSKQWVGALSLYGRRVINADSFLDTLKHREPDIGANNLTLKERRSIADSRAATSKLIKLHTGELKLLLRGEALPAFAQLVTQIKGSCCYDSGRLKFAYWELPFHFESKKAV